MTAPCYVAAFDPSDMAPGATIELAGQEGHHAATVRRTRVGERIDLVNGSGGRLRCEVGQLGKGILNLRVLTVVQETAPSPNIVLVQALAKGGRDEQAVETSTEFGASRIIPWQSARSIANWRGKEEKGRKKWQDCATAAAKQSRRAWIPEVEAPVTSAQLACALEAQISAGAVALICHEEATSSLPEIAAEAGERYIAVVGPEGGISPDELELFTRVGAKTCLLSAHVLRSATAGPYAIATIMASYASRPVD